MIEYKDLRINNILEYSGDYFKVKSIARNIIKADRNKGEVEFKPSELNAIPLSEEILLKCGFEKATDSFRGYLSPSFRGGQRIRIRTTNSGNFIYQLNKESNPLYLESLHQLQNLFHSLSGGQELNTSGL